MKLLLPEGYERHRGWNWTLCRMLVQSSLFEVGTRSFPYARVPGVRNANWTMMELNGALIGLDTWDTHAPTSSFHQHGFFLAGGLLKDVNLVLKLQYYKSRVWDQFMAETGIPVRPWTIMPTSTFPLGAFQWKSIAHRYTATLTGKNNRFGRQQWVDWCRDQLDFYVKKDYVATDSLDVYLEILKESRWGLILRGKYRNHDGKNRRECEFSSCGMPLALTYQPTYDFPMRPGEHFVLLTSPEDLRQLREIDPLPYARASQQLYEEYFSPVGIARMLIRMVDSLGKSV